MSEESHIRNQGPGISIVFDVYAIRPSVRVYWVYTLFSREEDTLKGRVTHDIKEKKLKK